MKKILIYTFLSTAFLFANSPDAFACIGGSAVRVQVPGGTILVSNGGEIIENTTKDKLEIKLDKETGTFLVLRGGQKVKGPVKLPPGVRSVGPCKVFDEQLAN